ncbi:MAG: hypothetical protein IJM43_02255 [Bacteroidaceae bacterium]|nr:hypothetical protein [Bacteroidaceae bacterium]
MKSRCLVMMAVVLAMAFQTQTAWAQKKRASMRMEICEAESNDNEFSVFTYKDGDGPNIYYLGLGRVTRLMDVLFDPELVTTSFDHIDETCIYLGTTNEEAYEALGEMLKIYDEDVDYVTQFVGRVIGGNGETLGDEQQVVCQVTKKLLGGKQLMFVFMSGKYRAEAFLGKSVIKELRLGLKIDKKLHKNRDK